MANNNIVIPNEFKKGQINFNNKNQVDSALAWMDGELKKIDPTPDNNAARQLRSDKQRIQKVEKLKRIIGEDVPEYNDPRSKKQLPPPDAN